MIATTLPEVGERAWEHGDGWDVPSVPRLFAVVDDITTVGLATTRVDFVVSNPKARNGGGRDENCRAGPVYNPGCRTYLADLTGTERVKVGYLSGRHSFTTGMTSEAFFDRLAGLEGHPFLFSCGYHSCDIGGCRRSPRSQEPQPTASL